MGKLKTKARLKLGRETTVQLPTGRLEDQITDSDLKNDPEKYIHQYGHLYENAGELRHEASTRSRSTKSLGANVRVARRVANNGVSYNVFVGRKGATKKRGVEVNTTGSKPKSMNENLIAVQNKQIERLKKQLEEAEAKAKKEANDADGKKSTSRKRSNKKDSDKK